MVPYFKAVNRILPNDVTAWPYRRQRIEICIGYPNGERCVFLPQCLAALGGAVEKVTYVTTYRELYETQTQRQYCQSENETPSGVGIDNVFHSNPCYNA